MAAAQILREHMPSILKLNVVVVVIIVVYKYTYIYRYIEFIWAAAPETRGLFGVGTALSRHPKTRAPLEADENPQQVFEKQCLSHTEAASTENARVTDSSYSPH